MRLYTFCNFYLSSIQQGIQSAHCLHEMFIKYDDVTYNPFNKALNWNDNELSSKEVLHGWAANHKTMIVLNGGDSLSLSGILAKIQILASACNLPYTSFCEDERSLNNALTCVGIILPESVYEYDVTAPNAEVINPFAFALKCLISQYPLAR